MTVDEHARNVKYGRQHRDRRERALQQFRDGDPCTRCFKPMYAYEGIDLDHDDNDPTKYRGLAHSSCNAAAGGRIGGATTAARYFGKVAAKAQVPVAARVPCACGPNCAGERSAWNSRCW